MADHHGDRLDHLDGNETLDILRQFAPYSAWRRRSLSLRGGRPIAEAGVEIATGLPWRRDERVALRTKWRENISQVSPRRA